MVLEIKFYCQLLVCLLLSVFAVKINAELSKNDKSIVKRGILHFNNHGHHNILPAIPHVHQILPKFHHIHHGGATVTSFNANYPRFFSHHHHVVPHFRSILPNPHYHHTVLPHIDYSKPTVPKYPIILPSKPVLIHSKHQCLPSPQFVPIPVPSETTIPFSFNPVSDHAQQLALNYHQSQNLIQGHQNNFPYSAAAETFPQNYDPPSNNGNYNGLNSYQV